MLTPLANLGEVERQGSPTDALSGHSGLLAFGIPLAAYTALAFALFSSAWQHAGNRFAGLTGDPEQAAWFLSWTPYALSHGHDPFFTTHLNYPHGVNLAWNTTMPLLGLLAWPVTAAFGPIASYNLLLALAFAASAWCAYLAIGRYVPSRAAAFVGGLLYGFSPYMTAQALGHLNLVWMVTPPLLFLLLDEAVVRQRRSPWLIGGLIGALAGLQFLVTEEVIASSALAATLTLVVLALIYPNEERRRLPYLLRALVVALPVFLVLAAWPLAVQFFGDERIQGTVQEPDVYVTDLANLALPTRALFLAPDAAIEYTDGFTGNVSEWDGYLGLPLLLLLAWAAITGRRDPFVRLATLSALAILVLSFGEHIHLGGEVTSIPGPWLLLGKLPLVGHILPGRLMIYVDFFAALLLAHALTKIATPTQPWRFGLAGIVAVGCLLPLVPRLPFPTTTPVVPAFFTSNAVQVIAEGAPVLVLPFPGPTCGDNPCAALAPMLWQAEAGFRYRMTGGYFNGPGNDGKRFWLGRESATSIAMRAIANGEPPSSDPVIRDVLLAEWRDWSLEAVILGPMPNQAAMLAFLTELLGAPPQLIDGVYLWPQLP